MTVKGRFISRKVFFILHGKYPFFVAENIINLRVTEGQIKNALFSVMLMTKVLWNGVTIL